MGAEPRQMLYRPPHLGLDLWQPTGAAKSVVVHAHGGGFVHGARNDRIARHFGPFLAERGVAFASLSYRKGGAPRRAFDSEMLARISAAAERSAAFYPTVRETLFGPALYRAAIDYADAVGFLLSDHLLGLTGLPWTALGNSSGGLAAIAVGHGLEGWARRSDLPKPQRIVAIASLAPQPWGLSPDGPEIALLCARGDQVFPRNEVSKLIAYSRENSIPLFANRIPYGQHTRPVREVTPRSDGSFGPYGDWIMERLICNA